ncbi:MAG: phage holin family protein [Oscillospiraceae bacterium]|jgi:hypothetical protein
MNTQIVYVAAITIIAWLAACAVKATKLDNRWLPVICGSCGGILGLVGLYTTPGFPADDALNAVAIGIVSGLAATGSHEMIKQITGGKIDADNGKEI